MRLAAIPLPNEKLTYEKAFPGGKVEATVVASTYYYDDERGEAYTVALLLPEPPYFAVGILEPKSPTDRVNGSEYDFTFYKSFLNIVPTIEEYQQCGGDY